MALREIKLLDLVDRLDEEKSEYADFFRPMLGYDAYLTLNESINDDAEPLIVEMEDEIGYTFPSDLLELYLCSNGGEYADLRLYPITNDSDIEKTINKLNVTDKSLKESLGLNNSTLLVGEYADGAMYVVCYLKDDGVYSYGLYDSAKKQIKMEFEFLVQLVALEVSYAADNEGFMEYANGTQEQEGK